MKKETVFYAAQLAEDKKAIDTEILNVEKIGEIADYIIITSATSTVQLRAIASYIEDSLSLIGLQPAHKEGKYGDRWYLLDYIDFVVHVIEDNARQFYNLEELWSKAFFIPYEEWH